MRQIFKFDKKIVLKSTEKEHEDVRQVIECATRHESRAFLLHQPARCACFASSSERKEQHEFDITSFQSI
jgi:hypothetical protein